MDKKMYLINKDGKKIIKNIPSELQCQYMNMGWKYENNIKQEKNIKEYSKDYKKPTKKEEID